jgi:hypothetical protein
MQVNVFLRVILFSMQNSLIFLPRSAVLRLMIACKRLRLADVGLQSWR